MKLTDHQQKMLDGAFGKGKAMAMQIQIGVGKCFDAERLVPVSRAHVSLSAQEADIWFAGKAPGRGGFLRHRADCQPRLFRRLFSFSAD